MSNGLKRWTMRAGAAAAIMSMAVVGGFAHQTTTAQASSQTTVNSGNLLRLTEDGRTENAGAEFTTDSGGVTVGPNAQTIPHFSGSFTSNGVRYPYTMVGNGPSS